MADIVETGGFSIINGSVYNADATVVILGFSIITGYEYIDEIVDTFTRSVIFCRSIAAVGSVYILCFGSSYIEP